MKICCDCNVEKPLSEYYAHDKMKMRLMNKCKQCKNKDSKARIAEKSKDPEWLIKEAKRCRERYRKNRNIGTFRNFKTSQSEIQKKHLKKYPQKALARQMLLNAVRAGILIRKPCEICQSKNSHGHHEDYFKPLEVVWLCSKHHGERHVEINDQKRIQKAKLNSLK